MGGQEMPGFHKQNEAKRKPWAKPKKSFFLGATTFIKKPNVTSWERLAPHHRSTPAAGGTSCRLASGPGQEAPPATNGQDPSGPHWRPLAVGEGFFIKQIEEAEL